MKIELRPLETRELDHELLWGLVGLAVFGGALFCLHGPGMPPLACRFKSVTGLPCVTCGSTRALLALAGLHPLEALRMNPLCAVVAALWMLYVPYGLAASLLRTRRLRLRLSPRDWFVIRFALPLLAAANWAWVLLDGR